MKTKHTTLRILDAGLLLAVAALLAPSAFGQGALLPPPGPPAPTMKTLDQIEARTIVNATNTPGDATNTFIITAPGSYYLTSNITGASGKHGISILADDVTLDLNGFALISGGGEVPTRGVNTTMPVTNFCIRNGSVRGWAGGGVWARAAVTLAEKLRLSDNGEYQGYHGLSVGNGSMVKDCVASGNGSGFYCPDRTQISNCIATENVGVGFDCTSYVNLLDCTASRNGHHGIVVLGSCSIIRCSSSRNGDPAGAHGIDAGPGNTIADCTATSNYGHGIHAGRGSAIRNNTAQANGTHGIFCFEDNCYVIGNTCDANWESGIVAVGGRVEGNSCTTNASWGFLSGGLLIRNSARGNSWRHGGGNSIGANFSHSGARGPILDMTAGGIITSTSPWANFVH